MLENVSKTASTPFSSLKSADGLALVARRLWHGPRPSGCIRDHRLRKLAAAIEQKPDDWTEVRKAIDETKLSAAYLSVRFKSAAGMPMRSYALWMKFEHACSLVANGYSPADAALLAGFADQSHLGRAARRFAKMSFGRAFRELTKESDLHPCSSSADNNSPSYAVAS